MSETDWTVKVAPGASRSLEVLPLKVAAAVVEFITGSLPTDPYRMSKPLRYELERWRPARRGDYRVIFQIREAEGVLYIGRVEHRAHSYKPRGGETDK